MADPFRAPPRCARPRLSPRPWLARRGCLRARCICPPVLASMVATSMAARLTAEGLPAGRAWRSHRLRSSGPPRSPLQSPDPPPLALNAFSQHTLPPQPPLARGLWRITSAYDFGDGPLDEAGGQKYRTIKPPASPKSRARINTCRVSQATVVTGADHLLNVAQERSLSMPPTEKLDTHHKALTLNLNAAAFGSFAEIGAGQEVSHWFFLVGGASATVAKTVCAYDKEVSDDLYGSGSRYVSRQRLEGDARQRVGSASRAAQRHTRRTYALLLFCRYRFRAQLHRHERRARLGRSPLPGAARRSAERRAAAH